MSENNINKNQLLEYRKHLAEFSQEQREKRDLEYLKKFHDGVLQGPLTGFPSLDKNHLKKKKYNTDYLPSVDMPMWQFMEECNKDHLDDISLIYDPVLEEETTPITFREFFKRRDELAKAYIESGVKKGDFVTVSLPSFVENLINLAALSKIGAIANQIHPKASVEEIDYYLNEANSKIFVGYGDVYESIKKIGYDKLEKVIIVSPEDSMSSEVKKSILKKKIEKDVVAGLKMLNRRSVDDGICISWKTFVQKGKMVSDEEFEKHINYDASIPFTMTHTSGSTGKSKGVLTNSKAMNAVVRAIKAETDKFARGDKELMVMPPFPLYIMVASFYLAFCSGEQIIVIPRVQYEHLSAYFIKHHPQHVKAIPDIADQMMKDEGFEGETADYVKSFISGGGKWLNEQEFNKWAIAHGMPKGWNGYGETEGGGPTNCMFDNTYEEGTVGRPLFGYDIKVVDEETREELPYGAEGEILIKCPAMMEGYFNNPEATEAAFYDDEDGRWLVTGDLGKLTTEGNLKVTGRLKRKTMIFVAKTNFASKISNDFMETTLCTVDGVENAVVVAVPNEESKNAFVAYVQLKDEKSYDKIITELDALCKTTFREYVSPIQYNVVDNIPKNAAGKNDFKYLEEYEKNPEVRKQGKVKVLYNKEISKR